MKLHYDNIVVGSNLDAVMFAFTNDYPIFYTSPAKPFRFDYFEPKVKLDFLGIPHEKRKHNCLDTEFTSGIPKLMLWERLLFLMSLRGLVPLSNLCQKMRCVNNDIVFSNGYSKILEINFTECYYFGDDNSNGFIKRTKLDEQEYICYDYIAFNKGGKHEVDLIHTGDDFVSEIWFYSSDRIDGNSPIRDACAVSKLKSEQLYDFDFSETMARFKTIQLMKDNGMRGKLSGYTKKGTARHYDFRTSSIRRETHSIRDGLRATSNSIEIKTESETSLLRVLQNAHNSSDRLLDILDVNSP